MVSLTEKFSELNIKNIDNDKQNIINIFNNNVKGVEICLEEVNKTHDGRKGH